MKTRSNVQELTNEFAWSWSRHQAYYECPRKIYWQHYGSWGGWKPDAPAQARLAYRLKHVKSVQMLVGEVFHDVLRERLRMRPNRPTPVPKAQMIDEGERRLLKRIRESNDRDWEKENNPKRYAILFEDYYGGGLTAAERDGALGKLRAIVEGFAASGYGERAFLVPPARLRVIDPDLEHPDDMRFEIDGVLVWGAPDLVVENKAGLMQIVDWKTGKPDKARVAQMAVYALYVNQKFGTPIENIRAHVVNIAYGDFHDIDDLRGGVEEARRMVSTYTADVRAALTDVPGNVAGDMSLFPMTDDRRSCRRCKYREICGRMDMAAEAPPDDESE